jgi:hypothetical protein
MSTATLAALGRKTGVAVAARYDVAADAKNRISLRGAKTKYFHVQALTNGCYVLAPRVLVSPEALSPRTLRMMGAAVANLKRGKVSAPIDLTAFPPA